jgi:hypothetical protein
MKLRGPRWAPRVWRLISRAALAIVAAAVVTGLWSRVAWALCPNCLAQRQTLTPALKLVGLFLLLPFAVAAVVAWVVRRALYLRSAAPSEVPPSVAAPPSPASVWIPPSGSGGAQGG